MCIRDRFTPDSSAEEQYGESAAIAYGAYPGSVIVYSANSKNEITEKDMWRLYPRPVPADEYVENYFRTMFYQTWNNSWTYQSNVQTVSYTHLDGLRAIYCIIKYSFGKIKN